MLFWIFKKKKKKKKKDEKKNLNVEIKRKNQLVSTDGCV